jgi:hypothetical protein
MNNLNRIKIDVEYWSQKIDSKEGEVVQEERDFNKFSSPILGNFWGPKPPNGEV